MRVRQVVTGHDSQRRSVFVQDEAVESIQLPGIGELVSVWSADGPATFPSDGHNPGAPDFYPPVGGVRFMIIELTPGQVAVTDGGGAGDDLAASMEDSGMHTSDTTDFEVILCGEAVLELEDGAQVTLGPGDVVVQNGTHHRWLNPGAEPAKIAIFFAGAHRRS